MIVGGARCLLYNFCTTDESLHLPTNSSDSRVVVAINKSGHPTRFSPAWIASNSCENMWYMIVLQVFTTEFLKRSCSGEVK